MLHLSQVSLTLRKQGLSVSQVFDQARAAVLAWLSHKHRQFLGVPLTDDARAQDSYAEDPPGYRFSWLTLRGVDERVPRMLSLRLDHPDELPGRSWSTDIEIAEVGDVVQFGLRLNVFGRSLDGVHASAPRVIADLASQFEASHGVAPVTAAAWLIDAGNVDAFMACLTDPTRTQAVIALAEDPRHDNRVVLDADRLARALVGSAVVAVIDPEASFAITDRIGKEWSVYWGGVRMYRAGMQLTDQPLHHPLWFPERLLRMGASANRMLMSEAFEHSVSSRAWIGRIAGYDSARAFDAKARREALGEGAASADLIALYQEEINAQSAQLAAAKADADEFAKLHDVAERERDRARAELIAVREQCEALRRRLAQAGVGEDIEIPASLDDLEEWATRHLSGRLVLLPRALRAAKQSVYEDPAALYQALLLLADPYRRMRADGDAEAKVQFEAGLAKTGFWLQGSGGEVTLTSKDYTVHYHGYRRTLDLHMGKGGGRDPRFLARIYFFWDDVERVPVVGWLPSHLDNSLT